MCVLFMRFFNTSIIVNLGDSIGERAEKALFFLQKTGVLPFCEKFLRSRPHPPFLKFCENFRSHTVAGCNSSCAWVRGACSRFVSEIKNVKFVDKLNSPKYFAKSLLIELADLKFVCLIIMCHIPAMRVCGACGPSVTRLWIFLCLTDKL